MTVKDIVNQFHTTPFLFVGSGMTRRYLGLPDWRGLLKHFAMQVKNDEFAYSYYENKASKLVEEEEVLPKTAELIQQDYEEKWYQDPSIRMAPPEVQEKIKQGLSPFKAEIATYVRSQNTLNPDYEREIKKLEEISEKSIAGIITTNYDTFLEDHCKGFKKYVGQEQLVFSALQGVAEIYKIHGSVEEPQTIVINTKDYQKFQSQSAYLAAKLMTIFVEYPIIFMGYSMSDSNIKNILKALVGCLNHEQLKTLQERFVFVDYDPNAKTEEITEFVYMLEGRQLKMRGITLSDFLPLYEAIGTKKSQIPVRLLRKFKQELYDYVVTNEPTARLQVASIEDGRIDDDELVLSIGRAEQLGLRGLSGVKTNEWYRSIVLNDLHYTADQLLEYGLHTLARQTAGVLPIHKYIAAATVEIPDCKEFAERQVFDKIISETFKKSRKRLGNRTSVKEIWIEFHDDWNKATEWIAYLEEQNISIQELEEVLLEIFASDRNILDNGSVYLRTNIRRLIRIYDYLKWGKGKEPSD